MRRFISVLAVALTFAVIFGLYAVKNDTRAIDQRVNELTRLVERGRADVAMLRAEWGYLTEPSRIERLAREHLGYQPMRAAQKRSLADLARGASAPAPARVTRLP